MTENALQQIAALTAQIAALPKGYISKKTVAGKVYYYHQWSENGSKQSKYLRDDEIEPLSEQLELRRLLQAELQQLKTSIVPNQKRNEVTGMKCTLMHKQIPVAEIGLDDASGFIQKVGILHNAEHLPIAVPVRKGIVDRKELNDWWTDRSIPASRSGVREALERLDISNTKTLLMRSNGLSLSDQYWICPEGSGLRWEEVNFFQNNFSDDIGDVLFGTDRKTDKLNFSSPDSASDGNLKKRWKLIDGKRCLIKGDSKPFMQQPFNEVIASEIMQCLGIAHIPYTLIWNLDMPYSVCEDFVDEHTDLIPAWQIFNTQKRSNSTSVYQHFINCCEALGIQGAVAFLNRQIVVDYLIANEDRHLNNFGVLRNAETLEWLGFAPIYDSGSCLGYNALPGQIRKGNDITCKPFKNHHEEQLKLVTSFDWLDLSKLDGIEESIAAAFVGAEDYIDASRVQAITASVRKRISYLEQLIQTERAPETISQEDDVEEDIAEDYTPKMQL